MNGRTAALIRAGLAAVGIVATLLLGAAAPSELAPGGWEAKVQRRLALHSTSRLWTTAGYIRQLGSEHAAIMAAVCLTVPLLALGRRRWALTALGGVVFGAAGAEISKHLVGREIGPVHALAYPSGHTAGATAVGVTLALIVAAGRSTWWVQGGAAALGVAFGAVVGWSTIATHAHFPADVLGGIAFGICAPLLVWGISDAVVWRPADADDGGPPAPVEAGADAEPVPAVEPVTVR